MHLLLMYALIRHPNRATQRAKTLMSYASELGLTGTIALCVQTKDTGVGTVMRTIVAAADAAECDDENDEASPGSATQKEMPASKDAGCRAVKTGADSNALLERATVARRVMAEARGLAVVEHSELLELLATAGCSAEQVAALFPCCLDNGAEDVSLKRQAFIDRQAAVEQQRDFC